jgi:ParB family chromosome partitioning protein
MSTDKYLTYRGDVRALAVMGDSLAFVTVHPEGQATALYRLDPEKLTLTETALPAGGQCLLATPEGLWVGGTDGRLYHLGGKAKAVAPRGDQRAAPAVALAPLAGDRLALASGAQVIVVARGDGKQLQTLEMPEAVTCLAADPTGQWLAAGTVKGTVTIFECETAADFRQSDTAPLHEAAVTALLFEADELRFLSAGADQKLLSTHARGRLEAEDRGRGANHTEPITAMIAGVADRFLTGSTDASLKSWPRGKGARPVTLKDDVGKVVALAVVPVHGKPQVVAACDDNTLCFFLLDDEGKFGEPGARVRGADDWAKYELRQGDPRRREAALRALAGWADAGAIKRLAAQMGSDPDHGLRLVACRLLAESAHPKAARGLEKGLTHADEAVRLASFEGLRRHAGPNDLRPLVLALKAEKADVGIRAVQALEGLAAKDDQALARLVGALEEKTPDVRRAALASLEKVKGDDSPEASLTALGSAHADLRRLALVRLFQRKLLHDPRVQAAVRRRGDDADPEVQRVAFLLSLYTRERLLEALRRRDAELDRQLTELESGTLPAMAEPPTAAETSPAPQQPAAATAVAAPVLPPQLVARVEEMVGQGRLSAVVLQRLQAMSQLAAGAGMPGGLNAIIAQIEALTGQGAGNVPAMITPPQPPEQAAAAVILPAQLTAQLEELIRQGKVPPHAIPQLQALQRMAAANPSMVPQLTQILTAQVRMLTKRAREAEES